MSGRSISRKRAAAAAGLSDSSGSGSGSGHGQGSGSGSRRQPQSERDLRAQKRGQLTGSALVSLTVAVAAVRVPLAAAQSEAAAQLRRARAQAAARRKRIARRAAAKAAQEAARRRAELKEQAEQKRKAEWEQTAKDMQNPAAAGLPSHWEPIDPSHSNSTLILLDPANKPHHADELAEVKRNFTATGGIGTIRSVHRVQNAHLHRQYEATKAALHTAASSGWGRIAPLEHAVYHGTRLNSPHLIHDGTKGFDPARGKSLPGFVWFAQHAQYSSSGYAHPVQQAHMPFGGPVVSCGFGLPGYAASLKQILQARICCTQTARPGGFFVVPRSDQCYPDYLITFQ